MPQTKDYPDKTSFSTDTLKAKAYHSQVNLNEISTTRNELLTSIENFKGNFLRHVEQKPTAEKSGQNNEIMNSLLTALDKMRPYFSNSFLFSNSSRSLFLNVVYFFFRRQLWRWRGK